MHGRLVVVAGPDSGRELEIPKGRAELGRSGTAELRLSDPAVSRQHAVVECLADGGLSLALVGDARATVNGLETSGEIEISEGDEIVVGSTRMIFLGPPSGASSRSVASAVTVTTRMTAAAAVASETDEQADSLHRGLGALVAFGSDCRQAADLDAACEIVASAVLEILAADRVGCFVADAIGKLEPAAVVAADRRRKNSQLLLEPEIAAAIASGAGIISDGDGVGAIESIVVPIPLASGSRAVIACDRFEEGRPSWGEDDLRFMLCVGMILGGAIDSIREREQEAYQKQLLEARAELVGEFIGSSNEAQQVRAFISKVAPSEATVLLIGESGVGKEVVANALHRNSGRSNGPFISINCAALQANLLESELFGHEKGAFTGAASRHIGRFERAAGGTLFLDELGELDSTCQAKLLRALEERVFERVGGVHPLEADVRIVAATNRNLENAVREGSFREDLYYRLSVIRLEIPPLRRRSGDVPEIAQHLFERMRPRFGRRLDGFSEEAVKLLERHRWPGNVRELRNAIERAGVLGSQTLIQVDDFPPEMREAGGADSEESALLSLREAEKRAIERALLAHAGNKSAAARTLGIDRTTLYKKIADHGIDSD